MTEALSPGENVEVLTLGLSESLVLTCEIARYNASVRQWAMKLSYRWDSNSTTSCGRQKSHLKVCCVSASIAEADHDTSRHLSTCGITEFWRSENEQRLRTRWSAMYHAGNESEPDR